MLWVYDHYKYFYSYSRSRAVKVKVLIAIRMAVFDFVFDIQHQVGDNFNSITSMKLFVWAYQTKTAIINIVLNCSAN